MKASRAALFAILVLCACLATLAHATTREEIQSKLNGLYTEEKNLVEAINMVKSNIDEIKSGKSIMIGVTDPVDNVITDVGVVEKGVFEKWMAFNILTGKMTEEEVVEMTSIFGRLTKTFLETAPSEIKKLEDRFEENKKWQLYYLNQLAKAPSAAPKPEEAASPAAPGAPAATVPAAPAVEEYVWVCEKPDLSDPKFADYTNRTETSLTAKERGEYGNTFTTTVTWDCPPRVLRAGQDVTLSASAPKKEGSNMFVELRLEGWDWIERGSYKQPETGSFCSTVPRVMYGNPPPDSVSVSFTIAKDISSNQFVIWTKACKHNCPEYHVTWTYKKKKSSELKKPSEEVKIER